MPFLTLRAARIAYKDIGGGDPIVFIHGHPFDHRMWDAQAPLAERYRLILPDLRGYGQSGGEGYRTMLDEMALDIAYLLDALAVDKAVVCGLSMGGQVALDFYRLFPARVRALVIADSDARGETPETYQRRMDLIALIGRIGMRQYTEEHIHEYIAPASIKNRVVYDPLFAMMAGTRAEAAIAAHRGRAERRDHTAALASIAVPTLLVVGAEDHFTPPAVMEAMRARIPGARLVTIPGAGHLPNMETPVTFNEALETFLGQLGR
ncbi:MAG TPA: alpha/beta fold hydrolase [Dinghuibacter sp.]|uniref:alpha/beta fold hydrolase n=1 Tax=Dinghuibacter sp. TaxID=2024697 RepID=UPI002CCB0228|nr:alpha/beta fold hydrolase [Dinghuibacter sp.]HTJ13024.1 alpha/beta fold hydrolase [Dinghuibacter sp.]